MNSLPKLSPSAIAPYFKLKDVYDRMIDLSAYEDKRFLLAFFRHAGCPFCNLRVHTLSKEYEKLKLAGFEMIFFFESKTEVILRSSFHQGVSPIPIISDPEKKQYAAYGLEESAWKSTKSHLVSFVKTVIQAKTKGLPVHLMAGGESINTIPAEFLIDKGLVIRQLHYSASLTDRMDVQLIRDFAGGRV